MISLKARFSKVTTCIESRRETIRDVALSMFNVERGEKTGFENHHNSHRIKLNYTLTFLLLFTT